MKHRLSNAKKRIVFGFSGSVNSLVLLHLINKEKEANRISSELEIHCVFVDGAKYPDIWKDKVQSYLESNCQNFSFDMVNGTNDIKFKNPDSQQQFAKLSRNKKLAEIVREKEFDAVIFASCQTSLATSILRDVSLGYAERTSQHSATVDRISCYGVPLGRPLRSLSVKEIALLFKYLDVKPLPYENLEMGKEVASTTCLGSLCHSMIAEVGAEYQATASAVFRTGTKLESEIDPENKLHCEVCYVSIVFFLIFRLPK